MGERKVGVGNLTQGAFTLARKGVSLTYEKTGGGRGTGTVGQIGRKRTPNREALLANYRQGLISFMHRLQKGWNRGNEK